MADHFITGVKPGDGEDQYKVNKYPWLQITLTEPVRIAALELQGYQKEARTEDVYLFKDVDIRAGTENTDLVQDQEASAMDTKNPLVVSFKGPLKAGVKEYLKFSEPYVTAKYIMIQRDTTSPAVMELAEVKVLVGPELNCPALGRKLTNPGGSQV